MAEVNPNAVWDETRCEELSVLERLIREVSAINNGNRCLERIGECIALAEKLSRTDYENSHKSFQQFLNDLAIEDRFGKQDG